MTAPEVDYADRLGRNLDSFLNNHRAELGAIMVALDEDIDILLMDMLMCGYKEKEGLAMMLMEHDGKDYNELVKEFKELVE